MESALYGIYPLVVFVSEISLVRFLIQKQLVCKYRTPALSMKYSFSSLLAKNNNNNNLALAQHTFLYICLTMVCTTTM